MKITLILKVSLTLMVNLVLKVIQPLKVIHPLKVVQPMKVELLKAVYPLTMELLKVELLKVVLLLKVSRGHKELDRYQGDLRTLSCCKILRLILKGKSHRVPQSWTLNLLASMKLSRRRCG